MEKTHGQIEDCLSLDSRVMARYKVFDGGGRTHGHGEKATLKKYFHL